MNQVGHVRLMGRDPEFHALTEMLAKGATGHGCALTATLEGPPGIGKTRLLRETAERARHRGYAVSWLSVPAVGSPPAVHAVRTALKPPGREGAGAAGPRLVVVDGIHNAQPRTANIIMDLLRSDPPGPEVRLIGLRGTHHGRSLERLLGDTLSFSRIELGQLSLPAGIELASEILQARPDEEITAMVADAGGNPLVISELARGLREEYSIESGKGKERPVPRRVHDVARHWLDLLSASARRLVQVAAAAGGSFLVDEVAVLCGETTASLLPALDEAMGMGLLVCPGERMFFPHELIRRSILHALPDPVRRALGKEFRALRSRRGAPAAQCSSTATRHEPPAAAFGRLGIVSLFADDPRAAGTAEAILASPPADAAAPGALIATVVLSNAKWVSGELSEGLRLGERALDAIATDTLPLLQVYPVLSLASKLSDIGRFGEAERLLDRADRETDRLGLTGHRAATLIVRARLLLQSGRLGAAWDTAQAGVAAAMAEDCGCGWMLPTGQTALVLIAARRGDLASAADYAWRCRAVAEAGAAAFPSACFSWAEFVVASADLGAERATKLLTTQYSALLSRKHLYVEAADAAPWFTRLALAANDAPLAASVVVAVERLADANPGHRSVATSAGHARALLERDTSALRRASREHASPRAGALAAEDLGELLAAQGGKHSTLASASLRSALERFETIGAQRDAERVRGRLKEHGVPFRDRSRDAARSSALRPAPDMLTDSEQTIARLVIRGLTNRQIARQVGLSPHTVNYHLRAIFRKLDISSRVEIARYVACGD